MPGNKNRMLIVGVSGMLGCNLAYYFRHAYSVLGLYHMHPVVIDGVRTEKADILSERNFKKIVHDFDPNIIIHCAALTNVDHCEIDHGLADRLNVFATRILVSSVRDDRSKLVYISSDSVYDGVKGNFSENDPVNPKNYYGLSKYKGELESSKIRNSLVLRTNFFGWNIQKKQSIAEWVVHELSKGNEIQGFRDVFFSSIYTFDLAVILNSAINRDLTGVFNCGSNTPISKYDFAVRIAKLFNLERSLIKAISIDDYNLKAKRGKNLTLNVDKIGEATGCIAPSIGESTQSFYGDYVKGLPEKIRYGNI